MRFQRISFTSARTKAEAPPTARTFCRRAFHSVPDPLTSQILADGLPLNLPQTMKSLHCNLFELDKGGNFDWCVD